MQTAKINLDNLQKRAILTLKKAGCAMKVYTITYRKKGNSLGLVVDRKTVYANSFTDAICSDNRPGLTWHSITENESGEQFYLTDIRHGVPLPDQR